MVSEVKIEINSNRKTSGNQKFRRLKIKIGKQQFHHKSVYCIVFRHHTKRIETKSKSKFFLQSSSVIGHQKQRKSENKKEIINTVSLFWEFSLKFSKKWPMQITIVCRWNSIVLTLVKNGQCGNVHF